MERERVVIVGAGPVGMVLALALARREVPVTVLEAGSDLATESRASTFHPPTLEMLDELGVIDPLLEIGLIAPVLQYRDFEEGVIADLDAGLLADETRYPHRLQCEQHLLTRIIRAELERSGLDVELRYGARVEAMRSHDSGAEVVLAGPAETSDARHERGTGGAPDLPTAASGPRVISASYVIAADGAHSAVREQAGIEFPGLTYEQRYLVVTTPDDLQELLPGLAYVSYVSGPDDWCTLIRTNRAWRALFPTPGDQTSEQAVRPEEIQRRLARIGGDTQIAVEATSLYNVHQRLASTFRLDRLLLAGDAAHINNPLGGLGMNSGVHDAYFLAALLAQVWKGDGPPELLDRYAQVRRAICEDYVNQVGNANYAALKETDQEARRERTDRMRSLAADPGRTRRYLRTALMLDSVRATRNALDAA